MLHETYLTYEEYKNYGGTLDETRFALYECKARKCIDMATMSRVQAMQTIPEAVKLCMVTVIGVDSKAGYEAQAESPVATSFSTDGYSETFHAMSAADVTKSIGDLIRSYLYGEHDDSGTPLLYRGLA